MPEIAATSSRAVTGNTSIGLTDMLRNGLNLSSAQSNLFADLMLQITAASQQKNADLMATEKQTSCCPDDTKGIAAALVKEASNDRAALQALMQRIREEAREAYYNRQRIKHVRFDRDKTEAPQDDFEEKPENCLDDNRKISSVGDGDIYEQNAQDICDQSVKVNCDLGNSLEESETSQSEVEKAVMTLFAAIYETIKNSSNKATEISDIDTINCTDMSDGLGAEDLLQAQQALSFFLNKMLHADKSFVREVLAKAEARMDEAQTNAAVALEKVANNMSFTKGFLTEIVGLLNKKAMENEDKPLPKDNLFSSSEVFSGDLLNNNAVAEESMPQFGFESEKGFLKTVLPSRFNEHGEFDFLNLFDNSAFQSANQLYGTAFNNNISAFVDRLTSGISEAGEGAAVSVNAGVESSQSLSPSSIPAGITKPTGSGDFASQLFAARAAQAASYTERSSLVEQVVLHLQKQVSDGQKEMTLQLRPAELGRIEVKLSFLEEGKVRGIIIADKPATLDLLLRDTNSLQRALQNAGLSADSGSLQFSLRGDGQANSFNQNSSGNFSDLKSQENQEFSDSYSNEVETYYLTPGGVNLHV